MPLQSNTYFKSADVLQSGCRIAIADIARELIFSPIHSRVKTKILCQIYEELHPLPRSTSPYQAGAPSPPPDPQVAVGGGERGLTSRTSNQGSRQSGLEHSAKKFTENWEKCDTANQYLTLWYSMTFQLVLIFFPYTENWCFLPTRLPFVRFCSVART